MFRLSPKRERILGLQTAAGDLVPLLEDVRGRAFRRDDRLRAMNVELVVRRYRQSPVVQILRIFEIAADGRYEIDYWCAGLRDCHVREKGLRVLPGRG